MNTEVDSIDEGPIELPLEDYEKFETFEVPVKVDEVVRELDKMVDQPTIVNKTVLIDVPSDQKRLVLIEYYKELLTFHDQIEQKLNTNKNPLILLFWMNVKKQLLQRINTLKQSHYYLFLNDKKHKYSLSDEEKEIIENLIDEKKNELANIKESTSDLFDMCEGNDDIRNNPGVISIIREDSEETLKLEREIVSLQRRLQDLKNTTN